MSEFEKADNLEDAARESIFCAGDLAVDGLSLDASYSFKERAACVRALRLINTRPNHTTP